MTKIEPVTLPPRLAFLWPLAAALLGVSCFTPPPAPRRQLPLPCAPRVTSGTPPLSWPISAPSLLRGPLATGSPPLSPLQLLSSTPAPTQGPAWLSWPHPFPWPSLVPPPSVPLVWKNPVQAPGSASSSPAWLAPSFPEFSEQPARPQRRPSDIKRHLPSPAPRPGLVSSTDTWEAARPCSLS